jgi:hypothetical protein
VPANAIDIAAERQVRIENAAVAVAENIVLRGQLDAAELGIENEINDAGDGIRSVLKGLLPVRSRFGTSCGKSPTRSSRLVMPPNVISSESIVAMGETDVKRAA